MIVTKLFFQTATEATTKRGFKPPYTLFGLINAIEEPLIEKVKVYRKTYIDEDGVER